MSSSSVVERIWGCDARSGPGRTRIGGWAGSTSSSGCGRHAGELDAFAATAGRAVRPERAARHGRLSLAPEVIRRGFDVDSFHVLDTTHPAAIRRLGQELDLERTLFVVSSKSGWTIETRSHLEHFWS